MALGLVVSIRCTSWRACWAFRWFGWRVRWAFIKMAIKRWVRSKTETP